jgi:hypothetical protein
VLLVSKVSRERIRSVSIDPASRTSAVLTRLLLQRRYGLRPAFFEGEGDADARLVIGDPALKTGLNGFVVLDLAAEWRAAFGHPFVFAFWAVAPGIPAEGVEDLARDSFEKGWRRLAIETRGPERLARSGGSSEPGRRSRAARPPSPRLARTGSPPCPDIPARSRKRASGGCVSGPRKSARQGRARPTGSSPARHSRREVPSGPRRRPRCRAPARSSSRGCAGTRSRE